MATIQTNIYDEQIYFAIIYGGQYTFIMEPDNWNKIFNHIPRDSKSYGFWSDFLEDKYGMRFTLAEKRGLDGGGFLLRDVHDTIGLGPDTDIFFEIGYQRKNSIVPVNRWRINLNEYDCENPGGVLTSIEKMPFQAKLKARMNTPGTLNGYTGVDGELLDQISTYTARLHSQTLLLKTEGVSPFPQRSNEYSDNLGTGNPLILQPDQSNLTINQLPTVFTQTMGLLNIGTVVPSSPSPINLFGDFISQYAVQYAGLLQVNVNATFNWWYWHDDFEYAPSGGATGWQMTPRLVVQRQVAGVWTNVTTILGAVVGIDSLSPGHVWPAVAPSGVLTGVTGADRNFCNKTPLTWNEIYTDVAVEHGDNVYVHLIIEPTGFISDLVLITVQADNFLGTIKYSQLTTTPGTTASSYRIIDVLNQLLENITGKKRRVISNFFSEGGAGWNYLLANGYGIRNFGGPAYKFKKDFESLVNDLQAIFCLGYGVKMIDGEEYFVFEEVNNFFKTGVIGRFPTYDWKDKDNPSVRYSKATIGFNKYEGLNIQQQAEFCTQGNYILQNIKTNDYTLDKKCGLIAAGTLLEFQRRNQFVLNPSQTLSNDDDIFIFATSENPVSSYIATIGYSNSLSRIYFNVSSMALQKGDTFIITAASGAPNDGIQFTVVEEVEGYPVVGGDAYIVTPAPFDDTSFDNTVKVSPSSPDQIFAERNQPFEICTNVVDPYTIYNGRLALKNILYNWRPVLGVGLYFVDTASQDYQVSMIKTQLVKMNSFFTHKFSSSEPHSGNLGTKLAVEIDDVLIKDYLRNGRNIYNPLPAECKIKIGWNDMNIIRFALAGELGDSRDHGGIELQDSFGDWWFCQVDDIKYDFVGQFANLEVFKIVKIL